jgi:aldehyde dehydrogenase (NAD+)
MRIAREEIFGPVGVVIPYRDENEAVAIANDSDFGLCGAVYGSNPNQALAVASRMRTGSVRINGQADFDGLHGGFKASGLGRENGQEGLGEYLEYRSICLSEDFAQGVH